MDIRETTDELLLYHYSELRKDNGYNELSRTQIITERLRSRIRSLRLIRRFFILLLIPLTK
jgi:hypothetical protein